MERRATVPWMIVVLLLLVSGFLGYVTYRLHDERVHLKNEQSALKNEAQSQSKTIDTLTEQLSSTSRELGTSKEYIENLNYELATEQSRNEEFEDQIRDLSGTVGQLDKLAKTDPELLLKYSKAFFLNEHYVPEKLLAIEKERLYDESKPAFLHRKVMPFFLDMVEDAKDDGINLWVASAYRSFDEQADLKGQYLVTFGSGSNTFSADQGFSEHQLGTTVDFTTNDLGGGLTGFETTPAYEWLLKNAHKYGFVLSYPSNNGYYVFEPWHWRFVGVDLARDLHDDDAHFYDLDQRDLDKYLISIFD